MSIFKKVDFTQVHDMVTCCILDYLIINVQQFGQVSYNLFICFFTTMLILCDQIWNKAIYRTWKNFGVEKNGEFGKQNAVCQFFTHQILLL